MLWQILNNVDTEKGRSVPLFARAPFLECQTLAHSGPMDAAGVEAFINSFPEEKKARISLVMETMTNSFEYAEKLPSPRVIKTHLPLEMLPPGLIDTCKVVCVSRNPKDACVSFFHHHQSFLGYNFVGNFEEFAKMWLDGQVEFGNYWDILRVNKRTYIDYDFTKKWENENYVFLELL